MEPTLLRCFLSFPSEHGEHAQFLKEKLLALYPENLEIFLSADPSSLPPGRKWYETVLENLERSDVVLVLLASGLAERPWVMFEAGTAVALRKRLVPLRYAGLASDQVPGPLVPHQSIGLTQPKEVTQLLLGLATNRGPDGSRLRGAARTITRYFEKLEASLPSAAGEDLPLLPVRDRIHLLTLASPTQRNLFFEVRHAGPAGILESEIRKLLPIKYNRHGEEGDPDLLISPSEYYFRLRELFFCGLIDMEKVSFYENRWTVREDITRALYSTPVWGAPRVGHPWKQQRSENP